MRFGSTGCEGLTMFEFIVAGIVAIAIAVYLVIVLLRPEKI